MKKYSNFEVLKRIDAILPFQSNVPFLHSLKKSGFLVKEKIKTFLKITVALTQPLRILECSAFRGSDS